MAERYQLCLLYTSQLLCRVFIGDLPDTAVLTVNHHDTASRRAGGFRNRDNNMFGRSQFCFFRRSFKRYPGLSLIHI